MKKIPLYKTFFMNFNATKGGMSDVQRIENYMTWRVIYKVWTPVAFTIAVLALPFVAVFVGVVFCLGVIGEMLGLKGDEHYK